MRKSWGITWRAVGVSPPSCPRLTRRAYAAPLAGFAATGDVTPLIVNPAIMPFHLCTGSFFTLSELMSLFRGSSLGTRCSGGSCLPGFSLEAGASSAVRSRAGALERELTASFQAAWSINPGAGVSVFQ